MFTNYGRQGFLSVTFAVYLRVSSDSIPDNVGYRNPDNYFNRHYFQINEQYQLHAISEAESAKRTVK